MPALVGKFAERSRQLELMDSPDCSFEDFRGCLIDLARVNRLTRAHPPTLNFIKRLASARRTNDSAPITILDVGFGYGDMLRRIDHWASRIGLKVRLIGVDLNPWSASAARQATKPERGIRWITDDLFSFQADEPIDIVISSLFAHHLDDEKLVRFLAWMEEHSRLGWFINDLHRHFIPYHFFRRWATLTSWHPFVCHDGPVSILRAFAPQDWRQFLASVKLSPSEVEMRWHMPFRLCLGRIKPA